MAEGQSNDPESRARWAQGPSSHPPGGPSAHPRTASPRRPARLRPVDHGIGDIRMDVLLAYDVDTTTPQGRRRLRKMAQLCEGFGLRVQKSVFEMVCSDADLLVLIHKAAHLIDPTRDSVRIYRLPKSAFQDVNVLGVHTDLPHRDGIVI